VRTEPTNLPPSHYRLIVERSPLLIRRADRDARCDYFNERWLTFTGRTIAQELGDGWRQDVHPEDVERCVATIRDHVARQAPFEMEYRLRRHDGQYRSLVEFAVPLDDDGAPGCVGAALDVDDRRRAEQAKASFLSSLSHDFRTPLTSMKAYVEVVRRKVARGDAVDDDVFTRLTSQIDRFASLLDDLGDAGRMEQARELAMTMEEIDLGNVVRDAVASVRSTLERGGRNRRGPQVALETAAGPYPMQGDPRRLQQIVTSLLDNALKFSPPDGTVRATLATTGREHRITVADSGIGIPADEIASIARPYYRAANATTGHYPGIGLGLAISREIAARHAGALTIESRLGGGTTVTVTLPARP
jgi:two-component system CheB/CheR fusion protein